MEKYREHSENLGRFCPKFRDDVAHEIDNVLKNASSSCQSLEVFFGSRVKLAEADEMQLTLLR